MKTIKLVLIILLGIILASCLGSAITDTTTTQTRSTPSAQVVNNSGGRIDHVKVGGITFAQNLSYNTSLYSADNGSYCGDGCSTGYFDVATGNNSVLVYATTVSAPISIASLGSFDAGNNYAVNVRKTGGSYCAELWKQFNSNTIFNNDTTRVLISTTCAGAPATIVTSPITSNPIVTSTVVALAIPTATITVDGVTSDWHGISILANDPAGDASPLYTGDDIKALYVAKDATNLYVRMDLWTAVNTNFWNYPSTPTPNNGRYGFEIIHNSTYSPLYLGVAYDNSIAKWSVGFNGSNGTAPGSLEGTSLVGVSGNVIELKIPLADIGNPTAFYSVRGEVNDCCIYNPNYNPPATLDEVLLGGVNQSALVYIEGHVYAAGTTTPVSGAVVSTSLDIQTVTTDANGYFFLQTNTAANYSSTPYTISISASGLTSYSQSGVWGDHPLNQIFHM